MSTITSSWANVIPTKQFHWGVTSSVVSNTLRFQKKGPLLIDSWCCCYVKCQAISFIELLPPQWFSTHWGFRRKELQLKYSVSPELTFFPKNIVGFSKKIKNLNLVKFSKKVEKLQLGQIFRKKLKNLNLVKFFKKNWKTWTLSDFQKNWTWSNFQKKVEKIELSQIFKKKLKKLNLLRFSKKKKKNNFVRFKKKLEKIELSQIF